MSTPQKKFSQPALRTRGALYALRVRIVHYLASEALDSTESDLSVVRQVFIYLLLVCLTTGLDVDTVLAAITSAFS